MVPDFLSSLCALTGNVCLCVQIVTGFLIYDWIEQPKKQEIIKEVVSLLEQKVLVPHSGEPLS